MRAGGERRRRGAGGHGQPRPHHGRRGDCPGDGSAWPRSPRPPRPGGVAVRDVDPRRRLRSPVAAAQPFQAGRRARASPAAGEHDGLGQDEAAEAQRLTGRATRLWRGAILRRAGRVGGRAGPGLVACEVGGRRGRRRTGGRRPERWPPTYSACPNGDKTALTYTYTVLTQCAYRISERRNDSIA